MTKFAHLLIIHYLCPLNHPLFDFEKIRKISEAQASSWKMQQETQIYGIRALIEALKAGKTIDKVFLQKGLQGGLFRELMPLLQEAQVPVQYVPVEKLNRLTKKKPPRSSGETFSPVDYHNFEDLVISVTESGATPLFPRVRPSFWCAQLWRDYPHGRVYRRFGDYHP